MNDRDTQSGGGAATAGIKPVAVPGRFDFDGGHVLARKFKLSEIARLGVMLGGDGNLATLAGLILQARHAITSGQYTVDGQVLEIKPVGKGCVVDADVIDQIGDIKLLGEISGYALSGMSVADTDRKN